MAVHQSINQSTIGYAMPSYSQAGVVVRKSIKYCENSKYNRNRTVSDGEPSINMPPSRRTSTLWEVVCDLDLRKHDLKMSSVSCVICFVNICSSISDVGKKMPPKVLF